MNNKEYVNKLVNSKKINNLVNKFFDGLEDIINKCKRYSKFNFYDEIKAYCYSKFENLDEFLYKYTLHYAIYLAYCGRIKFLLKKEYKKVCCERFK